MDSLILEPLKYYKSVLKERHKENLEGHFDELVRRSGIDVEQNRATVKKYDAEMVKVNRQRKILGLWNALFITLIVVGIVGIILIIAALMDEIIDTGLLYAGLGCTAGGFLLAFFVVRPKKKNAEKIKNKLLAVANEIKEEALREMAPLNALFRAEDTLDLFEKSMPAVKFDRTYKNELERELIERFDYIDMTDDETSVTNMLSGRLCDNPFLFERYVSHVMGTHVYHGTKTITWTETYRDSEGRMRTRTRTQVLHASLVKPKPHYLESTHLGFGSQAAPDLSFTRRESDTDELSEKALLRRIKAGEKKLKKQAAKALKDGKDFQEMSNTEFETLFGAKNRDHEVQFRLMYTPLGQTNTVDLLRSKDGYGDDFNFIKRGRFNIIKSEHAQRWDMDTSPSRYRTHSVDLSRSAFITFNENYFKSVFFDFAPLLAVPAYQEGPVASMDSLSRDYKSYYTPYEHEALANAIGEKHLAHPESATRAIFKTDIIEKRDGVDRVRVNAYSYRGDSRLDFVPTLGGDGRMHLVPVPWIEYIPVKRESEILVGPASLADASFNREGAAMRDGLLAFAIASGFSMRDGMNIFNKANK